MISATFARRLGVTLGAASLILGTPAAAFAGTPGSSSPRAATAGQFAYTDLNFGDVQCNEVHHPGPVPEGLLNQDPALPQTQGGYDTVSCRLASPYPLAGQTYLAGWVSDFGGQINDGLVRVKFNAEGTVYHGVVSYPEG